MKKVIIVLAVALSIVSCGEEKEEETKTGKNDTIVRVWHPRQYVDRNRQDAPVVDKKGLSADTDADKMYINLDNLRNDTTSAAQPISDEDLVSEARKVGGDGDLKLTLLWDFKADIDIHVQQPNGTMINFMRKSDPHTGGFLDVDNLVGGRGSAENIYWENPPAGTYKVWVNYYGPSNDDGTYGSGPVHVVLLRKGEEPKTFEARMNSQGDNAFITSFEI